MMTPEANSFYYNRKNNTLVFCPSGKLLFGDVTLKKVNEIDPEYEDESCSLEYFKSNYQKVAFLEDTNDLTK